MIADRVSTKNAIDFIQNVETAAMAAAAEYRAPQLDCEIGDEASLTPSSVPPSLARDPLGAVAAAA